MNKKLEELKKFERDISPDQYFRTAQKNFREYYITNLSKLQAAEKAFRNLVLLLLKDHDEFPEPKIVSRIKDRNECIKKFDEKYRSELEDSGEEYDILEHITDLIGVRIVCIYESNVHKVSDLICDQLHMIEKTDKSKDLEETEREFGYKSLHLDLCLDPTRKKLPEYIGFADQRFEIQIRTIVQDAWSEVDHKLKYKKEIPHDLKRRIYRLSALFELADQEFESIKDMSDEYAETAQSKEFNEEIAALDIFGFNRVASALFQEYSPWIQHSAALELLVGQIRTAKSGIKVAEFRNGVESNIEEIKKYKDYMASQGNSMNVFTQIRHCLYKYNRQVFNELIFDGHRKNFERWIAHGTFYPNEVPKK